MVGAALQTTLPLKRLTLQVSDLQANSLYALRLRCDSVAVPHDQDNSDMTASLDHKPAHQTPQYSHMTVVQTHEGVPAEPHPPTLMSCTPSSLHLCWAAPPAPHHRLALSYRLMCQVCEGTASSVPADQWVIVYEGPNTEVVIPGLCPAGQYNFKLQVRTTRS